MDAEWQIIFQKLEAVANTGAKVVLSKLPIGDLATQYFADKDIFCAGRVTSDDMDRLVQTVGGSIQSTCSDIRPEHLGTCAKFEERQIGGERFNFFEGCPAAKTCTLVLRGGAEQFIAEVERSLHDAIMIVKKSIKNNLIVAGGGAIEVYFSVQSPYLPESLLTYVFFFFSRWNSPNTFANTPGQLPESSNSSLPPLPAHWRSSPGNCVITQALMPLRF